MNFEEQTDELSKAIHALIKRAPSGSFLTNALYGMEHYMGDALTGAVTLDEDAKRERARELRAALLTFADLEPGQTFVWGAENKIDTKNKDRWYIKTDVSDQFHIETMRSLHVVTGRLYGCDTASTVCLVEDV